MRFLDRLDGVRDDGCLGESRDPLSPGVAGALAVPIAGSVATAGLSDEFLCAARVIRFDSRKPSFRRARGEAARGERATVNGNTQPRSGGTRLEPDGRPQLGYEWLGQPPHRDLSCRGQRHLPCWLMVRRVGGSRSHRTNLDNDSGDAHGI